MNINDFSGAKLAILAKGHVLAMLRDDRPDIPYPNLWDLPGGGRQNDEDPVQCALRETFEETGYNLIVGRQLRHWSNDFLLYQCHLQTEDEVVADQVTVPFWARLEVTDIQWLRPDQIPGEDWRIPGQIPELAGIIRRLGK